MQAEDPYLRGLAAWAVGAIRNKKTEAILNRLTTDQAKLKIFLQGHLRRCSVADLAERAMVTSNEMDAGS